MLKDFPDMPLTVLESKKNRATLLAALEAAFQDNPVTFYDKYMHSRRGNIDDTYDDLDLADESPAETAARMDAEMRGDIK